MARLPWSGFRFDEDEMLDRMKIRAVIADDEPLARRGIRQLLAPEEDVEVVAETRNGRETVQAVRSLGPDLLFLDVQMPVMDGFGVLRSLAPTHLPAVIFVTAFDDFAVRAFEAHAVDYLVKPIEEARFAAALSRTRERMRSLAALELTERLSSLLSAGERERLTRSVGASRLVVPTSTGDLLLDVAEIDWIEADDYYAAIHVRGRRYLLRQSLTILERRLDSRFVRAHRGAIVNIDRVRELRAEAGDTVLVLRDGTRVPVSRRRREHVTRRLRVLAG